MAPSSAGNTLARAFSVLRAVAASPGASLGEIAQTTGLARSTVQGIVNALQSEGVVARSNGQPGTYLGLELIRLASRVQLDVRNLLRPFMVDIGERFQCSTSLSIFHDSKATIIDQFNSNDDIRVVAHIGKALPLHCAATGKALASHLSDEELLALLGPKLEAFTDKTLVNPTIYLREIRNSKDTGLFVDDEEYLEGVSAMAVLLPALNNSRLALGAQMPSGKFRLNKAELSKVMLQAKDQIMASVGARNPKV